MSILYPVQERTLTARVRNYRLQLLTLLFATLAVWLFVSWALLLQRTIRYYCPLPAFDYWRVPYNLYFSKTQGLSIFLRPHNEHRIIFPEIVFLLDLLFRGRLILPIVVSFCCYIGTWLVLAWALLSDLSIPTPVRWFGVLLVGIVLGWPGAAVVIADPILLQWALSNLCVALAIFQLTRVGETPSAKPLAIAIGAATIATYTSLNCLLIWPVLLLEAWMLRLSRKYLAFLTACAVLFVAIYFVGYHPQAQSHMINALRHPLQAIGFLAIYLSMPFGLDLNYAGALILGLLNVVIVIGLYFYARRKWAFLPPTFITLLCLYIFTLITALLTTMGRFDPASTYGDAAASRFWAVQLLGWSDLGLLYVYFAAKIPFLSRAPLVFFSVLALLVAFGTLKLHSKLGYEDDQFSKRQLAALGFENGLQDDGLTRRIFPDPALTYQLATYLKAHRLSIYSLPVTDWPGKPASALGSVASGRHPGAVTYMFPVENGLEVVGWAEPDRRGDDRIVLLNENQTIVGFGGRLAAGFPVDLRNDNTPTSEAWVAFVNFKYSARTVSPYWVSRGHLQPFGSAIPVNLDMVSVAPQQHGKKLQIDWQPDAAWKTFSELPQPQSGTSPEAPVVSTWKQNAHTMGQLTSVPFPNPPDNCIVIPVLHGPNTKGLSIQILNSDDGKVLASIPFQPFDIAWRYWRVSLDKSASHLHIVARDQGRDWGEWLAIGAPSDCAQ
ncbi:MAG TPA: hypothetical protein VH302_05470 [Bryobacteraceae bacterium]|nr:hypothetical protein [Bryobacteraceae bacterium]